MLDVLLTFDVEDVYFDPKEGGDDYPVWIAETLERHGLTGTFMYVGDKVRRLKKNGRHDVAQAMSRHSIGMHINSNVHPTMPEYTSDVDWDEGLARVREEEYACATVFEDFFGRSPEATSRHNVLGSTQQYAVAAEMGIPALYGVPATVATNTEVSFCCGALNTSACSPGLIGTGFDRSYSDDQKTDECISKLGCHIDKFLEAGRTCLTIFLGHPVMMRGVSPWFLYYMWPNGRNLTQAQADELGRARLKPASVMPTVKKNFDRICQHIAAHPDLDVINMEEFQRRYGEQKSSVTQNDLVFYIERFLSAQRNQPEGSFGDIPLCDWFSPAEIVAGLTDSIVVCSAEGGLPAQVLKQSVLGPTEVPLMCPEWSALSRDQVVETARSVQDELTKTGHLPGNIRVDGKRIGLGSYLRAASDYYQQLTHNSEPDVIELPRVSLRYPNFAHDIDTFWRRMVMEDGTIDPEINMEFFCKHARLQSWTVKPAQRKL